jgi:hypothetical protein
MFILTVHVGSNMFILGIPWAHHLDLGLATHFSITFVICPIVESEPSMSLCHIDIKYLSHKKGGY